MPEKDPGEWFLRFLEVHMGRFPGMTWPDPDSEEFAAMVEGWIHHFRLEKVTQDRANRASLALMVVSHYPNNHLAEFFRVMPEAPLRHVRLDPESASFWKSGLVHNPKGNGNNGRRA